jgi:hypothetical protein
MKYCLNGKPQTYALLRQLNSSLASKNSLTGILKRVPVLEETLSSTVLTTIKRYLDHVNNREAIRIDVDSLNKKIALYSKKASRKSKALVSQLEGFKSTLTQNHNGDWHRPVVNIFGAKTGRDTVSGNTLNLIPKCHWQALLSPSEGYCYVLLDYDQQEPMIAAHKAGCSKLLSMYELGDIYEMLKNVVTHDELERTEFKKLMLMHLYGAGVNRIAQELSKPELNVMKWLVILKKTISPIDYYLDDEAFKAKRKGKVSSIDWRMVTSPDINPLTIRNWPIQATGADIMRRACFNLDKVKLPVLLTNHDSFLVKLDRNKFTHQLRQAKKALMDASSELLDGFQLRVKVEIQLPSKDER